MNNDKMPLLNISCICTYIAIIVIVISLSVLTHQLVSALVAFLAIETNLSCCLHIALQLDPQKYGLVQSQLIGVMCMHISQFNASLQ